MTGQASDKGLGMFPIQELDCLLVRRAYGKKMKDTTAMIRSSGTILELLSFLFIPRGRHVKKKAISSLN